MPDLKPFTIDRRKWVRGRPSLLLDVDGCGCAVGLLLQHIGVPQSVLLNQVLPPPAATSQLDPDYTQGRIWLALYDMPWPESSYHRYNNSPLLEAMKMNDVHAVADWARENRLKELFAKLGYDLSFEN